MSTNVRELYTASPWARSFWVSSPSPLTNGLLDLPEIPKRHEEHPRFDGLLCRESFAMAEDEGRNWIVYATYRSPAEQLEKLLELSRAGSFVATYELRRQGVQT